MAATSSQGWWLWIPGRPSAARDDNSPPHLRAVLRRRLPVVRDGLAVERAVERGKHAALGEVIRRGLPVARAGERDVDFGEDASRRRAHHEYAVGEHDRLVDIVR